MHKSVEEFKVETLEVGGLVAALQALRLPYGKEALSKENYDFQVYSLPSNDKIYEVDGVVEIDGKDLNLLQVLLKRGDEHAKVLRGVMVWCSINAPRYFWVEMDTYRIGAERLSSESTMHIEGRGLPEDELIEKKEHLEEGHMQKRIWMFSYQTLRRIYYQRRNHRLPQWRVFCDWIKTLPLAEELIVCDGGNDNHTD